MPRRLLLLFVLAAWPAFPVAKEILEIQRDIAQLQDQVRSLQRSFDERFAVSQQLLNQNLEAATRLSNTLAVLQKDMQDQGKVLQGPLANTNAKVDSLASQFQGLREAVDEMNSKLSKLQQQIVDIKNIVSTVPPPAAPAPGTAPAPGSTSPPSAPPASELFRNAMRDYQAGNYPLAGPEFTQYIQAYGKTDQASVAQFYLGEIFYQQADFEQAQQAFDKVLEQYPEGDKTADAQYKKGMCLLKQERRDAAAREFHAVIKKYPGSAAAKASAEALRSLGLSARPAPGKTKSRRR
ncbi:MAG TPA: tetratricopeptide repeat protein [Bryobacterales bacterium]|nr:tetratricopeptide repeat protein [Bryobacterales bacterium]